MPSERPSVFIVDDHGFFRAGLRSVLGEHGFPVVGEAPSGEAALPLIERRQPDLVVMDLSMPGMSGAEATREIMQRFPVDHGAGDDGVDRRGRRAGRPRRRSRRATS